MKFSVDAAAAVSGVRAVYYSSSRLLETIWRAMKMRRKFGVGPLSFVFAFERKTSVTRNSFMRKKKALLTQFRWKEQAHRSAYGENLVPRHAISQLSTGVYGQLAMIVGVGPGFGYALARRLAKEGMATILVSRNAGRLDELVKDILAEGGVAFAYGADATDECSVKEVFDVVHKQHGVPDLVVYSLQYFTPGQAIDTEVPAFEEAWRHNCFGSFLIARSAAKIMVPRGSGTIVLTDSTSSLLGRKGHLNLAVGKFGQRALAQVMARELWPQGIHVAHLVIDADIAEYDVDTDANSEPQADPIHIADMVIALHRQPNSAWSSEVDIRPARERFWEHC